MFIRSWEDWCEKDSVELWLVSIFKKIYSIWDMYSNSANIIVCIRVRSMPCNIYQFIYSAWNEHEIYLFIYAFIGVPMAIWHQRFCKKGQHMIAVLIGFRWAVCCLNFCEGKKPALLFSNSKIMSTCCVCISLCHVNLFDVESKV